MIMMFAVSPRHWLSLLAALSLSAPTAAEATAGVHTKRHYDLYDYYALHLASSIPPESFSDHLGLHYEGPLGELPDHYIFRSPTPPQPEYDHVATLREDLRRRRRKRDPDALQPHPLDHILLAQKQEIHKRFPLHKRSVLPSPRQDMPVASAVQKGLDIADSLGIQDPIFQDQWHLYNHVQLGHDINVTGVWAAGTTGHNTTVCIVDDGLDMDSADLRSTYFREGSWDYNDQVQDPKPRLADDRHGTRCAGEVAAARNNACGVGIAYDGRVSGVRILSKVISDADEAAAMNHAFQSNQIYSCSWGPPDDGQSMEQPGILIRRAMVTGVQRGRGGLGSVYVFAIGNGAANDDNCNFDGYTNSIYSVSVGGIDRKGLHPYYSEKCSAQLVVTYSSGSGDAIHTTDVGANQCYNNHGGTSAAGPLVAGMYALMLQVNPRLTWRDVQWITVLTAVKIDQPGDWTMNTAIGKEFSHDFGYGKADAWALVEAAKNWTNVNPQAWYFSPWLHVRHPIPQGDQGLASSFDVTPAMLRDANFKRVEHVTVTMNVAHTRRGDLSVELRSPSGMVSHIATARRNDNAGAGYVDWTFMSVAHWGEDGVGKWTVVVKDTVVNVHEGTFTDWRLKLWGECIEADQQGMLPLPTDHDDDDHEEVHEPGVSTTSVVMPTETGAPVGNPSSGHPERPTKPTATATATPQEEAEEQEQEHLLPHIFPTFGVTKQTQIWIYGSLGLILIFLVGLGAWYWRVRARRRRWLHGAGDDAAGREGYEFEIVGGEDEDDEDGEREGGGGLNGHAAARKVGKKKAGRLYDAFAPGSSSDEEEEDEEGEEEDEDEYRMSYRDIEPMREGLDVE